MATEKEKLEVLKLEYSNTCVEYNDILKEYRKHTNLLNFYTTAFTGVLLFIISAINENNKFNIDIDRNYIISITLIFSISLLYYIYSSVIDVVYNLYLVEAKRASLEIKINDSVGSLNLLNWDSKVIRFFNEEFRFKNGWVNPSILTGFATTFGFFIISMTHCIISFILFPNSNFSIIYTLIIFSITIILLHQFFLLQFVGRNFIFKKIYEFNNLKLKLVNNNFSLLIIPILTFILGGLAFIFFSIKESSFWISSSVDFPYILIWTMSVGDTLLLPYINWRVGKIYFKIIDKRIIKKHRNLLFKWVLIVIVSSILINSISHYIWANDEFIDFLSISSGNLTIGGWWHLIFSVIQMFIIGMFFVIWYVSKIEKKRRSVSKYFLKTWYWIIIFSSLMIANFVQQYFDIYKDKLTFFEALLQAKFTFAPLALVIIFGFVALKKSISQKADPNS